MHRHIHKTLSLFSPLLLFFLVTSNASHCNGILGYLSFSQIFEIFSIPDVLSNQCLYDQASRKEAKEHETNPNKQHMFSSSEKYCCLLCGYINCYDCSVAISGCCLCNCTIIDV